MTGPAAVGSDRLGALAEPGRLVAMLRRKGLPITLGQEIRLSVALARLTEEAGAILDADEAARWVAPLLATTREEQEAVAEAVRAWWHVTKAPTPPPPRDPAKAAAR